MSIFFLSPSPRSCTQVFYILYEMHNILLLYYILNVDSVSSAAADYIIYHIYRFIDIIAVAGQTRRNERITYTFL